MSIEKPRGRAPIDVSATVGGRATADVEKIREQQANDETRDSDAREGRLPRSHEARRTTLTTSSSKYSFVLVYDAQTPEYLLNDSNTL